MSQDFLALRAAEKSFYDALGRSYPSSPRQLSNCIDGENVDSPDDPNSFPTHSFESCSSHTIDNTSDSDWDGTNPIVVNSGNKRKKLNFQDKATISAGDIIELIPGHHLYKYKVLGGEKKGSSVNTGKRYSSGGWKGNEVSSRNEGSGRNSELNLGDSVRNSGSRGTREKRIHWMGDSINEEEGRGSKLSAASLNDSESTEMFDEVLLCNHRTDQSPSCCSETSQNG